MKAILPNLDENSAIPLYVQIFEYIRSLILKSEIVPFEKLPSLRNLSEQLEVSLTTVELAYAQLNMEGYIFSKPRSGYYVSEFNRPLKSEDFSVPGYDNREYYEIQEPAYIYDLSSFDFVKWKKCQSKILTNYPQLLLFESDPQGELALRNEIAKYVFSSRGVTCSPSQIVISAGLQQITSRLAILLKRLNIQHVALEEPGYFPINNVFKDRDFAITKIPVLKDGIDISLLPINIRSAAYVNPSNQFPTGAIMPIGKRYQLLEWAIKNNSYIIEDDYDSELRYFGKPIPAMQGLDDGNHVIYLGSFSSTLFSSIKISYMILPPIMQKCFESIKDNYSQTCSKTEQLTLSLFMEKGYYKQGIKKIRRLYSQKLNCLTNALKEYPQVNVKNTFSGIHLIINVKSDKSTAELSEEAKKIGIRAVPFENHENDKNRTLILYYNQLPLERIPSLISEMIHSFYK